MVMAVFFGRISRQYSLILSGVMCVLMLSSNVATASESSQEKIKELLQQATDARRDAEDALLRAKAAEAGLANLLNTDSNIGISPKSTPSSLLLTNAERPARMDCINGDDACGTESLGYDLLSYPYLREEGKDRDKWAETRLINFVKKQNAGVNRKISFNIIDQPFDSRISLSKGDEAIDAQYAFPLSRRRRTTDSYVRAVTSTLSIGFSASLDPSNKKVGLIARGGSFADDQLALNFTFGRQYHPAIARFGNKGSAEAKAKSFANALIARCKAAMVAKADHFGEASQRPTGCDDVALLAWAFDPKDAERYKTNVAVYNEAFWDPDPNVMPEIGWGVTTMVGMKNFKYILPNAFSPGIVIDPQTPNLLSTLLAQSKDGSKPNLGQIEVRRISSSLGTYVFRRFEGKARFFDGLLVRPSATVARRWEIEEAFADKEYCAIKVGTIGECKKFNTTGPEANWSLEPALNLRTQIDLGLSSYGVSRYFSKIGLSPTINYNSHKDSYRLVVPAYLAADKDGKLTGGVQFARDWGNADPNKNVSVWSVFLSTPFSMDGSKN
ncbi:hypothetical protein [Sphingobium sp. RAC03]|uniref:hypothetical protein n=1 Tax=Sphingobium sp. RAC03 TaxID=1843368 RepID=UPI0008563079|nr:hypothetical protein [Sphingobium sp. RAC03]AOF96271.1 hypothetical protein BSY17_1980 [Sphingobium sp. RAC03]